MLQTWGSTVWSALSVTGTHVSDPIPLRGSDFVRAFYSVTVQSFTYVQLGIYLLSEPDNWQSCYDAAQVIAAQRFTTNKTGCTIFGAFSAASPQRAAQLPMCASGIRFRIVVSGSSGTPGSMTLYVQGLRRSIGSYQAV